MVGVYLSVCECLEHKAPCHYVFVYVHYQLRTMLQASAATWSLSD